MSEFCKKMKLSDYCLPEGKPPEPVLDKEAVKTALKEGREVPGAKLDDGKRLKIK